MNIKIILQSYKKVKYNFMLSLNLILISKFGTGSVSLCCIIETNVSSYVEPYVNFTQNSFVDWCVTVALHRFDRNNYI